MGNWFTPFRCFPHCLTSIIITLITYSISRSYTDMNAIWKFLHIIIVNLKSSVTEESTNGTPVHPVREYTARYCILFIYNVYNHCLNEIASYRYPNNVIGDTILNGNHISEHPVGMWKLIRMDLSRKAACMIRFSDTCVNLIYTQYPKNQGYRGFMSKPPIA